MSKDNITLTLSQMLSTPIIKKKSPFELALDKLDLQGVLLLLSVLSEKALYLQSIKVIEDKKVVV